MKETRHTGSFTAVDEDNIKWTLHILTDFVDAGTFADPHKQLKGFREIRTDDGGAVTRLAKGEYQVIDTGKILRSEDPLAP